MSEQKKPARSTKPTSPKKEKFVDQWIVNPRIKTGLTDFRITDNDGKTTYDSRRQDTAEE